MFKSTYLISIYLTAIQIIISGEPLRDERPINLDFITEEEVAFFEAIAPDSDELVESEY